MAGRFQSSTAHSMRPQPRATFGEEPWAGKLRAAPDEPIPMFRREDIHVVVVGGETNGYWRIMGATYQKTASVDTWR